MSTDVLAPPTTRYRTAPSQTETGLPSGVPYIIGNEAAERFSFYGMRTILITFMMSYLLNQQGAHAGLNEHESNGWFHLFVAGVYYTPVLGAFLSDGYLGKYRTILYLSIVYCLGHFTLAFMDTHVGIAIGQSKILALGLILIALGSGGIKPCVSANVGDQFGESNKHLLSKVFGWFYFSINFGSSFSIWLCPLLLKKAGFGPAWAFGVPGVFMVIATVVFWLGRHRFVHVPAGGNTLWKDVTSPEGRLTVGRLASLYVFILFFWALWDQSSGGEWSTQAKSMNTNVLGLFTLLPEQVQIVNGLLVLAFIPLFNYVLYPAMDRLFALTPIRKMAIGMFVTASSFGVIWLVQRWIDGGARPSILWQLLAYALLTAAEVLVSITGLEFSYTQAPNRMKSLIMALWLLTVALGNQFVSVLNFLVPWLKAHGMNLDGAGYFRFFTFLMLGVAAAFALFSRTYRGQTYIQHSEDGAPVGAPIATINSAVGDV